MTALDVIVAYLDDELDIDGFDDYGPNGLQVPGATDVARVATGVSANLATLEAAAELRAELVIVHHGLFWDFHRRALTPTLARRLRLLLEREISLAGYHLPLDAHPRHGNNALLADALGCVEVVPFGAHRGRPIGVSGRFGDDGIEATELIARVRGATAREPLWLDYGPPRVRSIGIVSGAAASSLSEAVSTGLDAFLTGEPSEHVLGDAREAAVHFIAAGHYATETRGVRRLGELVAARFGVEHHFIDVPNPI
ncbi:MAG: Nif3-like dinuclear metal center hexameric protein [Solirubrobacteraceae bacterium]|nr:MAG: Nif3-like dinuclear metal center hexameric protein [Solirubrobacterales bacterium]